MDIKKWHMFSLLEQEFINEIKIASVFGQGNEAVMVMKNDDVYAFGANNCGCLGVGDLKSCMTPTKVVELCGKGIVSFAFGAGPHLVALTSSGELYTWGHNGYCELATGSTIQCQSPFKVDGSLMNKVVVEVACGSHHTVALTSEGEVFAWGQNKCGQVGSGANANQNSPRRVNSSIGGKFIIGIACGNTSTVAVTNNGEVFCWGCNGNGQLGNGNNVNQVTPCKVVAISQIVIVKVVCGSTHTLALSDEGKLYGWGSNSFGQLALPPKTSIVTPEHIMDQFGRIVDIASHYSVHISAALTQNSKIYMWGHCRGQVVSEPILTKYSSLQDVFACFSCPPVTYKPLQPSCDGVCRVEDSIRGAFDDERTSDLIVRVENKNIHVHKAVLKIRCEHFRTMFQDPWEEDTKKVLEISQFSYPVYRAFLLYLYTDEVELAPEQAVELLDLANAYCEDALKRQCERVIRQGIDVENAALLYYTALHFHAKELEEFCFRFSLCHMTAVVQSKAFNDLDETTVKHFILKAARAGVFKT